METEPKAYKVIDGYLVDEAGNMASLAIYRNEDGARMVLESLTDCVGCVDCVDCTGCRECTLCTDCTNCVQCIGCDNCRSCVTVSGSDNCEGCVDCKECKKSSFCYRSTKLTSCVRCSGCIDCWKCSTCITCEDCYQCSGCISCYTCKDCTECFFCKVCSSVSIGSYLSYAVTYFVRSEESGEQEEITITVPPDSPIVPKVENIDVAILAAVTSEGNSLDMEEWHRCETEHCRAGWAVHLAGKEGHLLEEHVGDDTSFAALLIHEKSGSHINPCRFYESTKDALFDIKIRAHPMFRPTSLGKDTTGQD